MIQHNRPTTSSPPSRQDGPEIWGQWSGRRHYSLEVVQHPLRARMCGFGDKDRRPLAPAAVAKMIVKREDDSIVDIDEVDYSFFLVTVDLWSADGKQEMNLVLHPSAADRYVPTHSSSKPRRRGASTSAPARQPGNQTPVGRSSPTPSFRPGEQPTGGPSTPSLSAHTPYGNHGYFGQQAPSSSTENVSFPQATNYGPAPPPNHNGGSWGYSQASPIDRSQPYPPPILPSIRTFQPNPAPTDNPDAWSGNNDANSNGFRGWRNDQAYTPVEVDPSLQNQPESRDANWDEVERVVGYTTTAFPPPLPATYSQYPQAPGAPAGALPTLPRHSYTRTLVGPLSANACRLLDEHRKPGIFFLFQDLSVRTEGTFRLRMRLMNVGAPPAPESGATHIHTDVSPVLAQTFTEEFTVFSAKRFPGVPDTTALSIAFGNQGQKLPLRNRHGSKRRRRGGDDYESDDDSDGA